MNDMHVDVNVMRARLTIVGFNVAIVSFQLRFLKLHDVGTDVLLHLSAEAALLLSLALSLIAMIAFILSSPYHRVPIATLRLVVASDLLMYLALAQTIQGFFPTFLEGIDSLLTQHGDDSLAKVGLERLRLMVKIAAASAWALALYVGPIVSLWRASFSRRTSISYAIAYAAAILILATVSAELAKLQAEFSEYGGDPEAFFLGELVQPFRW